MTSRLKTHTDKYAKRGTKRNSGRVRRLAGQ